MKAMWVVVCACAATSVSANPVALSEVQFDLNSVAIQAFDQGGAASAFGGESHTGTLVVSLDADSALAAFTDGSGLPAMFRGGPDGQFSFSAQISLDGGMVTGLTLDLSIDNGADSYSASIVPGSGTVTVEADADGNSFAIDGLLVGGEFSDAMFGDIDVSALFDAQPLLGNLLVFDYRPNAAGFDSQADIEFFTTIPSPGSAALLALSGCAAARRRR